MANKFDEFEKSVHKIIMDLILLNRKIPNNFTKKQIKNFVYYFSDSSGFEKMLRKYDGISKKALEKVKECGLDCKEWKHYQDWKKHNKDVPGIMLIAAGGSFSPTKKLFHSEHHLPCAQIMEELIEKAKNVADVKRILAKSKVFIITTEENEAITKKGWAKKRPEDAYDKLKIKIVDYWKE